MKIPIAFTPLSLFFALFCTSSTVEESRQNRWMKLRSAEEQISGRVISTQLLKQFRLNYKAPLANQKKQIPLIIEARLVELEKEQDAKEDAKIRTSSGPSWDSRDAILGHSKNIFTFWDDPICDTFLFPKGLFVCGNARIRGSLTILSGMNLSTVLESRSVNSPHIHSRCTVDPFSRISNIGTSNIGTSPPRTVNNRAESWCFINLTIRSANVFALNSVEVSGSLYVESLRVDAGTSLFVGLRGLIYTNQRLSNFAFARHAEGYSEVEAEMPKRRRKSEGKTETFSPHHEVLQSGSSKQKRERLTLQRFREMENEKRNIFESEWKNRDWSDARTNLNNRQNGIELGESGVDDDSNSRENRRFQRLRQSPKFEELGLAPAEIDEMECPIIDTTGAALFLKQLKNGSYEFETHLFPPKKDTDWDYGKSWLTAENFRSGGTPFSRSDHSQWDRLWEKQDDVYNPFGTNLPFLEGNATMGDLVTLSSIVAGNAGLIWVFGNIIGSGVILDASAQFHSHCGHFFMNLTNGESDGNVHKLDSSCCCRCRCDSSPVFYSFIRRMVGVGYTTSCCTTWIRFHDERVSHFHSISTKYEI